MRYCVPIVFAAVLVFTSCQKKESNSIIGSWQLVQATLIQNNDTTVTDYTKKISFIKIINETHFAFLQHARDKNDTTVKFSAGGGKYSFKDSLYIEQLEYCSAKEWEGNEFPFKVTISNDTLVQYGREKVPGTNIDRINEERYMRIK